MRPAVRLAALLTHSSVAGPARPLLTPLTLPAFFAAHILAPHAPRTALSARAEPPSPRQSASSPYLKWSFAEFDDHIAALARGFVALGVRKGDRVAVIMGNNSAYALLQWACARVGAILVTINPAYRQNELLAALRLAAVSHLFLVPHIRSSSYLSMLASSVPALSPASQDPLPLKNIVVVDPDSAATPLERALAEKAIDWRELPVWRTDTQEARLVDEISQGLHADEVINLQFTSGTTGAPKAVSLTHHNLLNNARAICARMHLTQHDILCNVPPLFHCFGLVLGNLAAWSTGAHVVYPAPLFDPRAIVDAIDVNGGDACTALHGVPTHFLGVLNEVERRGGVQTRLRTGIAAGSPIPIELMRRLIDRMGLVELTNAYGMTETSPVSFQTTPADPLIKRVETVGRVLPHVRAKVVDTEGGVVPVGVPGEVCVAGYLVQKGYWEDEAQTRSVMRADEEGTMWMHTGDEGIMDAEGYLRIVGRIKDIIIRGGENLFPVQIENVLTAHAGVQEAAAVAVPDTHYGEVVGAWIARAPRTGASRAEVRQCVAEGMNPQNAPAWVWFLGEDGVQAELPKTASGKVMKHVLREWSRELAAKGVGRV